MRFNLVKREFSRAGNNNISMLNKAPAKIAKIDCIREDRCPTDSEPEPGCRTGLPVKNQLAHSMPNDRAENMLQVNISK